MKIIKMRIQLYRKIHVWALLPLCRVDWKARVVRMRLEPRSIPRATNSHKRSNPKQQVRQNNF